MFTPESVTLFIMRDNMFHNSCFKCAITTEDLQTIANDILEASKFIPSSNILRAKEREDWQSKNIPTNVRSEDEFCPGNKFFMCKDQQSYYTCEEAEDDKTVKTDELKQCGTGLTCDMNNNQPCVESAPPDVEYCPNNGPFVCQDQTTYYLCEEYFNNTTVKSDELQTCSQGLVCDMNAAQHCTEPVVKPPLQCKDNETIFNSTCGTVEVIIQIGDAKFTLTVDDSTHIMIPTTGTGNCVTLTTPNGETRATCNSSTAITQDQCGLNCDPNVIIQVQGGSPATVTIPSSDADATLVTISPPVSLSHRLLDDDTQLFHSFKYNDHLRALSDINKDLTAISEMSSKHDLKLNPNKSVALIFGNRNDVQLLENHIQLTVEGIELPIGALVLLVTLSSINAEQPTRYKTAENGENQAKYEYEYRVHNNNGVGQGKAEIRDGVISSGRYYVEEMNSSQNVEYVADDGGYHPYVEYKSLGPHSQTVTHMAMDEEAINTLNNKHLRGQNLHPLVSAGENQQNVEQKQVEAALQALRLNQSDVTPVQQESKFLSTSYGPTQTENIGVEYIQPQQDQNVYLTHPSQQSETLPHQPQAYVDQVHDFQGVQQYVEFPFVQNSQENVLQANDNLLVQPLVYQTDVPAVYPTQYQDVQESHLQFSNEQDQSVSQLVNTNEPKITKPQKYQFVNRFKDLISDQDVLDINKVVNNHDQITATPQYTNQATEKTLPAQNLVLSEKPIVVVDMDRPNNYHLLPPTTNALRNEGGTTVIVTPRPIHAALLAPLTAGIELPVVPAQEKKSNVVHENFVVDVQQSIPYYLGKIEYYDGDAQSKNRNVTETAAQHLKLGDFLQQPIIEKSNADRPVLAGENFPQALKNRSAEVQESKNVQYHHQMEKPQLVPIPVPIKIELISTERPFSQYTSQPYPVLYPVSVGNKIPLAIERPLPHYVPKPYPVQVPQPIVQAFYLPVEASKPYPVLPSMATIRSNRLLGSFKQSPKKSKSPQNLATAASYQHVNKLPCVNLRLFSASKSYCDNYIGLVPPKLHTHPIHYFNATKNNVRKQRTAMDDFESSIRWEYGFMPPLIPSLAIDENGNPIEKHTK
ncbi:hypothetical protein RI129_010613 [Pyrocoelia pectoralis]|uniref:Uncharacterized protein n=1 Tax=Pyrocoelia pectoralis TaxID=417401 RepID=A0AAN7ZEM4_9COLE